MAGSSTDDSQEINNANSGEIEENTFLLEFKKTVFVENSNVEWSDVAGLEDVKQALNAAVAIPIQNQHTLTESPTCCKRILLIGPPGTGKTYIVKALATHAYNSTFFSVSSSDVVSKWAKKPEKLIKYLFEMARARKPSIIFIDEVDMLCLSRLNSESVRRIKTELVAQIQNVDNTDGIFLLGATNSPWLLDSDVLGCYPERIYIPLPEKHARMLILKHHLGKASNNLTPQDIELTANKTEGYSGADVIMLTRDAQMHPVRKIQSATHFKKTTGPSRSDEKVAVDDLLVPCDPDDVVAIEMSWMETASERLYIAPVTMDDVLSSLSSTKPTVDEQYIEKLNKFREHFR